MNKYKRNIWISGFILFLLMLLITFATKFVINPFLLQQQESLTQQLNLRNLPTISDLSQLDEINKGGYFSAIEINNASRLSPLAYENEKLPILSYLLPIPASTARSYTGQQSIIFKANNSELLGSLQQILLLIYAALILTAVVINLVYIRFCTKVEASLVQELSDDHAPSGPFLQFSQRLAKQKNAFRSTLDEQKKQIAQLTQQVNMDNLTGLHNRHAFRKELTEILNKESEQHHAMLFILRASELNTINSQRGFQYGDEYIINIAKILNKVTGHLKNISTYRISGSDFALIGREMNISNAQQIAKNIKVQFDQYQALNELDSVAYTGISAIISGQLPEQVLARTDMALAKAQTENVNSWAIEQEYNDQNQFGQQHWREIIEEIIANRALMLLHQPIQAIHRNMKGYQEIFTRFIGDNNNMIPTDTVFAMAQRVDMIVKLEQLILETVVNECRHRADESTRWGVNLSSSAIQNSSFIVWLERLLLREPDVAACLIFEMREEMLESNLVASKRIFDILKRSGTRSAICEFGKGVGSFRLFKELKPDFVKIDANLINNIERDSANQQFVRMIIDVAHRMDCQVIAEGIEHLGQKRILEGMYVDGIQGFLIARPSPL